MDGDWKLMELFLGMHSADLDKTEYRGVIGGEMKERGTPHWKQHPSDGTTNNASGFSAHAAGTKDLVNGYSLLKVTAIWWTSSPTASNAAWLRLLSY